MFPVRIHKRVNQKMNLNMNNRTVCMFHKTDSHKSGLNQLPLHRLGSDLSPMKRQTQRCTRKFRATPIPKNESMWMLQAMMQRTVAGKIMYGTLCVL